MPASVLALCVAVCLIAPVSVAAQTDQSANGRKASTGVGVTGDRTVVAQVNGKPIYKADVDQAVERLKKIQEIPGSRLPEYQAAVLDTLIGSALFNDYIERNSDVQVSAEEVDKQLEQIRGQLREKRRGSLEQYVRQLGLTVPGFRSQLASDMNKFKFVQVEGTKERVEDYFKRYRRHFDGTQIRVSHILLRPKGNGNEAETKALRAQAEQIKADIESGKLTFAEAARRHSAGPSRQEGGDLGFISRQSPMVEEFNRAAFDLEKGQISGPVISTFGVHLITVTEVKEGGKTLELVRDEVMRAFSPWLVEQLIESEKKKAKIEFNESFPHFKPGTRELASAEK